jgi:hypothetical protein
MWTDPDPTEFETGDILTEPNIGTYILDNLLSLPHVIDNTPADLDIVSTVAETTLYSVTIPANSMGANGTARLMTYGDIRGNTSGDCTCTFRAKFGGSTLTSFANNYINNAVRGALNIDLIIINQGATNAQVVVFGISEDAGDAGGAAATAYPTPVTAAIDTTVDQALMVTAQWATSSGNNSARRLSASTTVARN